MFKKILIANRGEIACRVMHTAKKMGIQTVAVYSEADRDALHVSLADDAVCIGPAPSRESYLQMDRIIEACKQTGAQAIHPGYGFLSENEVFAKKVEDNGIVFIGPKHASIAAMGDKIASKRLALQAGVNTIAGHNEAIESPQEAVRIAQGIGYPVMIKASAGGGGKGLRVAYDDAQTTEGYAACRNEARNSFGDDRVFIEKFIESPRHIEIQVLADAHGHCIYLGERECSLQRRHQKVIEEAPSPFISQATREAMGRQAVALAQAVQYQSAGTVEFVVDKDQRFYFLEMNTRLQVEHPVTECITGLDLVEQMIRIAAGEHLTLLQSEVALQGWAIECRINAEDPSRHFLPSTGRLVAYEPPLTDLHAGQPTLGRHGLRVDTGVFEGGQIPMFYDSMIAKVIAYAPTRQEAIQKLRDALDAFVIRGVSSNVAFQAALLSHPQFVNGDFNTGFIAEHFPQGHQGQEVSPAHLDFLLALVAAAHRRLLNRTLNISGQMPGHERQIGQDFVIRWGPHATAQTVPVQVVVVENRFDVELNDQTFTFEFANPLRSCLWTGTSNAQPFCVQFDRMGLNYQIQQGGVSLTARVMSPRTSELLALMPAKVESDLSKMLIAPMPGLLVDLCVTVGQTVHIGQRLAVIEAMKMENTLLATQELRVKEVVAQKGQTLAVDEVILRFE
jgi:propionyl-CoA carboxylase alpha chain